MGDGAKGRRERRRGEWREDVQVQREDVDQDDAEEERRHRIEHEGDRRHRVIAEAVALDRLRDADRHRDQQREDERGAREVDAAPGVLLEQRCNALPQLVGVAEVELDQMPEIGRELGRQRPVVSVLLVPGGDCGGLRPAAEYLVDRAARNQVQQLEGDRRDPNRDHERDQDAPDDVSDHGLWRGSTGRTALTSCSPTRTGARTRTASG